jgi:hypothetical protein
LRGLNNPGRKVSSGFLPVEAGTDIRQKHEFIFGTASIVEVCGFSSGQYLQFRKLERAVWPLQMFDSTQEKLE